MRERTLRKEWTQENSTGPSRLSLSLILSLLHSLSLSLSLSLSVYVSLVDVDSETGIVGWKHGTMTENLIRPPDAYATLGVPL